MPTQVELTEREIRAVRRIGTDLPLFARHFLRVKAKDAIIRPLILNRAQIHIHRHLEQQRERTGKVRAILLKGRQQGASTYVAARFYHRALFRRGFQAFILSHRADSTDHLYNIVKRYHEYNPLAPPTKRSNRKELIFDGRDSGYVVATAGGDEAGRSMTAHLFHGSEVAFWPNAENHMAGVMQAIPDEPGTEIILESTANGVGGVFYDLWQKAESGDGEFMAIFVPWFWQPEYRAKVPPGFRRDEEEEMLRRRYGLNDEQLAWRRNKLITLGPEKFKQEYPCCPQEAFIFSGRSVFLPSLLQMAREECYSPRYRAEIAVHTGRIEKREDGRLSVWEDPKPGRRYVIGADVAEGIHGGDYSCADVLEYPDGHQVAQWHGHIDPDLFGLVLEQLGLRYNRALIGVERNNHGLTTLTILRDRGYPNLYAQADIEHRSEGRETKKIGWLTTRKSKLKIIDQMVGELRDGELRVYCRETIDEMETFVEDDDGGLGAKPGCHDDRVMARAIAGEMLRYERA